MKFGKLKKEDGTPFKVFTPFWRRAEKHYLEKFPHQIKRLLNVKKKFHILKIV